MIESWWQAHELELVIAAGAWGVVGVVWLFDSVATIIRERRNKRRAGIL